jgi:hypothetical protein
MLDCYRYHSARHLQLNINEIKVNPEMYDLEKHKMQLNIPKKQLCLAGHAAAIVTHILT